MDNTDVIPNDHYIAASKALFVWSDLEFMIDRAVWKMMNVEQPVAASLTAQYNSIFQRLKALSSLLSLYKFNVDSIAQINKFYGNISALNEQRNRIVHDPRFLHGDSLKVGRFEVKSGKSISFGWKEESIQELDNFREDVNKKRIEFIKIWKPILAEIESSPDKFQWQFDRITLGDLEKLDPPIEF